MTIHTHLAADPASSLAALLDRTRHQRLPLTELFQLAESFNAAGRRELAAELYKSWVAYNDTNPLLHLVCFNYSVTLRQMGDLAGSIHALRACLKLEPRFGQGHINLGRALEDSGLTGQAIQQWKAFAEMTAEITPEHSSHRLMALQHAGRVLENAGVMEEAETALWKAIELRPDKTEAGQHWTSLRQRQCKWPTLTPSEHVSHRQLLDSLSPLTLACHADDPVFQLAKAYRYCRSFVGRPDLSGFAPVPPRRKSDTGERLRVGYVSSDLRDHAVGFALSEVFETHDKSSVECYAYYCGGASTGDATQARIMRAVDCWRDISALGDSDAARQIIADEIDILVDVNGYTKHARTRIFAYRPAPVIVNFCGYPGTMGSPFHQYIIADDSIIPPANEIYYTEKVLRIPCNQPVDRKRQIAARPSRAEAGLPEDAFVFACFNGMQKITSACFDRWMAILSATSGSVLWLLGGGEDVDQRLRREAEQRGVAPERLIFASKAPNPKHLARIGLADLFLDTFPYGAHSTAADAVTMGLPVLTFPGNGFASRFCASIVAAAGAPELICEGPDEYVEKAIGFERDRDRLAAVRQTLESRRDASALRDIPGLVRRLEHLYRQMQAECERGETPVPDLSNLDVYYEVGAEVMKENIEFEDSSAYRQRYAERLAQWHAFSPIAHDSRLWQAATAEAVPAASTTDNAHGKPPVILVTFAGRQKRMEILTRYIRAAMDAGVIDEWHVWDFTRSQDDHEWVTREFGPARYMGSAVPYQSAGSVASNQPLRLDATITNDLHIAIIPNAGGDDAYFELVVGGWGNSKSVLRKLPRSQLKSFERIDVPTLWSRPTPGILSPGTPNRIVLDIDASGVPSLHVNNVPIGSWSELDLSAGASIMVRGGWGADLELGNVRARVQRFVGNPNEHMPYWQAYDFYATRLKTFRDCLFLKCDDDIVYMDLEKLGDFVEFRRANPKYLVVSANVVNNGVCAHWQQQAGSIPERIGHFERPPGGFGGSLWQSAERANELHDYFLQTNNKHLPLPTKVVEWTERQSINFIAWLGRDLVHMALPKGDDEGALTVDLPTLLDRPTAIYSDFTVSHLSFGPQEQGLDLDRLIDAYDELMRNSIAA